MAQSSLVEQFKKLYLPTAKKIELVDVPRMNFLIVDGKSAPESPDFQQAIEALYGVCFTMKFMHDKGHPVRDTKVLPLEALWWTAGGGFDMSKRSEWHWTAMIMQPDVITRKMVDAAVSQLREKKNPAALSKLRFERFHEGLSVQTLHIGPYSAEPQTIERMQRFAAENGYRLQGKHHEIYHSDPRRTKPERLKTVLRHPVAKL